MTTDTEEENNNTTLGRMIKRGGITLIAASLFNLTFLKYAEVSIGGTLTDPNIACDPNMKGLLESISSRDFLTINNVPGVGDVSVVAIAISVALLWALFDALKPEPKPDPAPTAANPGQQSWQQRPANAANAAGAH